MMLFTSELSLDAERGDTVAEEDSMFVDDSAGADDSKDSELLDERELSADEMEFSEELMAA